MIYSGVNEFIWERVRDKFMINIPMLDRKTSKKYAYEKKQYTKGYKIPIISDAMFEAMINNESRKKYAALIISSALKRNKR